MKFVQPSSPPVCPCTGTDIVLSSFASVTVSLDRICTPVAASVAGCVAKFAKWNVSNKVHCLRAHGLCLLSYEHPSNQLHR